MRVSKSLLLALVFQKQKLQFLASYFLRLDNAHDRYVLQGRRVEGSGSSAGLPGKLSDPRAL